MDILNIDLNNVNLDNKFDEDGPDAFILIILLACHIKFEKCKERKKRDMWKVDVCIMAFQ